MNQPALFSTQVTTLTRDVDKLPQLNFAVDGGVLQRRLQANQSAERGARAIENPDRRAKDLGEKFQRTRDKKGQAFGALQREHLRHQLAQHNVQKSDGRESNYDRENVRDRK